MGERKHAGEKKRKYHAKEKGYGRKEKKEENKEKKRKGKKIERKERERRRDLAVLSWKLIGNVMDGVKLFGVGVTSCPPIRSRYPIRLCKEM